MATLCVFEEVIRGWLKDHQSAYAWSNEESELDAVEMDGCFDLEDLVHRVVNAMSKMQAELK